jgi:fructose-1,6-bisphosphatase II
MMLANEATARRLALAVARTACAVLPLAGCGDGNRIDHIASETLAQALNDFSEFRCVTRLCEGKKDEAPWLPEGTVHGSRRESDPAVDVLADPVEGTTQLAGPTHKRTRGSFSVLALAPGGSVASVDSGCYARKLVLPPGSPRGIGLDTPEAEIVRQLASTFARRSSDVTVWILDRPRNREAIENFRQAGASVRLIAAGDFEVHLRAGHFVAQSGPIHVSCGIGGLSEGVLAVPFLRWSGATMLLEPWPSRPAKDRPRIYDGPSLIASTDCILAVAGISDGSPEDNQVVPGIRFWKDGAPCLSVFVASPGLSTCRTIQVTFEDHPAKDSAWVDHRPKEKVCS